ncbi:MAG: bifunctional (p)ppGpp synthetase/guanosine-3',5'-bis(diphosphate) 3'-pyrophosphohydrolase, partial [Bacteroidaceae bacterium]|nr:bifunctional (p)ppGpp synthetase/guanosine-3',5'-bis(diphosphate) 3'-pyrophosphohydrolase [Bacteroidaceae bacterium]
MKEILKIRTALSLDDYRNLLTLVRRAEAANANECDGIGLSHYLTATGAADVLHNQIGMSGNTVLLPLVSTLHEIGAVSIEEIARLFNSDLAEMTEYYKQLYSFSFTQENATDEQFANFVISFARDIRVVIASVAAFYVRMQMVDDIPTCAYRPQMALFSRTFFAPLCHRLGLYDIKRVFEDLSVKYEHTDVYNAIRKSLKQTQEERDAYVEDFVKPLREKINLLNLPYKIKWRTKSIHSIYKKMQKKGIGVEGIYDLFAVRVILDVSKELEQAMCWAVFGLASSIYTPNTLRTKDWISRPKSSG